MDQYIKNSIDNRKKVIDEHYKIPEKVQIIYDELFRDMEELGNSCTDVSEFESKFTAGPLNQRYMDLFTQLKPKLSKVKDAYKEYLATDEGQDALLDTVQDSAETSLRIAANDLVKDALDEVAPNRHMEWRNSIFGKVEDTVEGVRVVKNLGGLFKSRKNKDKK